MKQSHNLFSEISPASYAEASALARVVGENMIARLELVTLQPKVIVDLGGGTGYCADLLKQRYPEALIIAIDSEEAMLRYAASKQMAQQSICAEAQSIPLMDHSVDLIFANLLLPWCDHWEGILDECRRVLRKDGLFMFSCLGLDTLRELSANHLILKDMHEVGDVLVQEKFSDPVMDVEYLTLTYRDYEKMREELHINGFAELPSADMQHDSYSLTFEVIYGHAWGLGKVMEYSADDAGVVRIPLAHLKRDRG